MGKTKKLRLVKRMLAMMLAVAMSVTMVPSTALAAPADDTAAENIVLETGENGDTNTPGNPENIAPEDDDESEDDESVKEKDVNDDASDGDADQNDKETLDDGSTESKDESTESKDGSTESKMETNEAGGETPAAKPAYEISLSGELGTKAEYNGSEQFADILYYVTLKKDGEEVSGDGVTCTWKEKGADGYAAMAAGAKPTNAGSYQAVLNYPPQDGVHDGAELTQEFEITKAPVRITLRSEGLYVKPGTKKSAIAVPVIDGVIQGTDGDVYVLESADLALAIDSIKDAVTDEELDDDDVLTNDGDYAIVLTPSYKADLAAEKKAQFEKNFELKPFTADIEMADLIYTEVTVKLADAHKQEGETEASQITKEYDGKAKDAPEKTKDYTVTVKYQDTDGTMKEITDAETTGEWEPYEGSALDANGKVKAPTNAGYYTYKVVYPGKDGVYAGSETYFFVEITQAELKVEAKNASPLTVPENITVGEVLAKIEYKVTDKDGKDVTEDVKAKHIWGTSYSSSGRSQIYEPLFTVEESSDGTTWSPISKYNTSQNLVKGTQYRVTFTGRKAVLNASGSYTNIIDDIDSSSVNGVDPNYTTVSAGKELAIKVEDGTKGKIDVSGLLGENKGAKTIKELVPKQYDGKAIYVSRSAYKNVVKLVKEDGTPIPTEQHEFTYTWYRYRGGDRIDAELAGADQSNTNWSEVRNMVSPQDAGVYKLEISYEDKIDPETFNYADPEVVYFAIDPRQVIITPKAESYEVLEGRSVGDFFYGDKEIEYEAKAADGKSLPEEDVYPRGQIVKKTTATPAVQDECYDQDDYNWDTYFERKDGVSYVLQGLEMRYRDEWGDYSADSNYTCTADELVDGARKSTPLNTETKPVSVVPMGDQKITITADTTKWAAKEKVYDAKPFEVKDLVPDGMVSVKKADGTEVSGLKLTYEVYYEDEWGYGNHDELKYVVDAGSYELYVRFDGDKDYAPFGWNDEADYPAKLGVKLGTFKITKREIALKADLDESYKAGIYASDIVDEVKQRYEVTNYVKGQEEAFVEKDSDGRLKAWEGYGPDFYVAEKDSGKRVENYDKLKRDKTYEVRYDTNVELVDFAGCFDSLTGEPIFPARDYTVKNDPVAEFKVTKGNSSVDSVDYSGTSFRGRVPIEEILIRTQNDAKDPMKREVTMREAIKWSRVMLDGEEKEGNLIALRFTAPEEYDALPETAMYENAIKAAGGYVLPSTGYNYFTAVFDATKASKDPVFNIRWEDGYVETYTLNLKDAVKLANLEDAVAPKALAFNAANGKMAVGETQQLDVKITKEQMGDVIYLGYESSDTDKLVVTENGGVTALKMGPATVTVFAQHLVNGKVEPLKDANGKYVKSAQLKINVTKLDAPKKVKATPHGTYIDLTFDAPANGYRREIYVAEKGKFANAAAFDNALKGMKENQWKSKGFAIAPIYSSLKMNNVKVKLQTLDVSKDYTIYVRNVCAVRTLTDGTGGVVTQAAMNESAAGVVVNAKTKKAEVQALDLVPDLSQKGVRYDDYESRYTVELSEINKGTVVCLTEGQFNEILNNGKLAEETTWIKLPFVDKNLKNTYEVPKLEYTINNCWNKKTERYEWGTKNDIASIDKKGNLKVTGSGWLEVRVRDTVTAKYATCDMYVNAQADSVVAAKGSVTLSVGQSQELEDLLAYKLGNMKLTAYDGARQLDMAKVRAAIKEQEQTEFFKVDEYNDLIAINGGGKLVLDLTDKNVEKVSTTEKATAKVTIKSKDLEPVKSLKACDVSYDKFGLTFSYTGHADEFLLEVSDAKKPIYSKVISRWGDTEPVYAQDKSGRYIIESYTDEYGYIYHYRKEVKNAYQIPDWFIEDQGIKLSKDSQYTVSLTPIYGANKAKPAVAKVKTTKIPAMSGWLHEDENYDTDDWTWIGLKRGGMSITVSEADRGIELHEYNDTLHAVSGNTYTLTANPEFNRGRVNDTLVWTVGDAKVANVKAAAGTYCITLKGLKPGSTTLEVKSKLLGNKVIARYDIEVEAVKNAYDNAHFYGENEPRY